MCVINLCDFALFNIKICEFYLCGSVVIKQEQVTFTFQYICNSLLHASIWYNIYTCSTEQCSLMYCVMYIIIIIDIFYCTTHHEYHYNVTVQCCSHCSSVTCVDMVCIQLCQGMCKLKNMRHDFMRYKCLLHAQVICILNTYSKKSYQKA